MSEHRTEPPKAGGKVDYWLSHCVHRIATGQWSEGDRLPSVRQAKSAWSVDQEIVLRVYEQLEQRGLVDRRPRSGFFVKPGEALGRLCKHRHELDHLYERCSELIREGSDFSPLGAFRYFAKLAELRARETPEFAFLECTSAQASGHAAEIHRTLGVPCLPLTTGELASNRSRVPTHINTLLVSAFHWHEAPQSNKNEPPLDLIRVPIELDPNLLADLQASSSTLFEFSKSEAESVLQDLRAHGHKEPVKLAVVENIDDGLTEFLAKTSARDHVALLSPRAWGRASKQLRQDPQVSQLAYRIAAEAWPTIASRMGLPLGELA